MKPQITMETANHREIETADMFFDVHTHVFPEEAARKALPVMARRSGLVPCGDGTLPGLEAAMEALEIWGEGLGRGGADRAGDQAGVACADGQEKPDSSQCQVVRKHTPTPHAMLQPVATRVGQAAGINRFLLEQREQHPRVCSFGALHPLDENLPKALEMLKKQGFFGVKIHPDYQGVFIDDPRLAPLWQAAQALQFPVLMHCGLDIGFPPPYRATPEGLARLLDAYPRLSTILAHMGGYCMWQGVARHIAGRPGVYLDTAMSVRGLDAAQLAALITLHGPERVLFGSDWPWGNPAEHVGQLLDTGLSDQVLQNIFYGNAARLFGLEIAE